MKKSALASWIAAVLSLVMIAVLILWPAFRTAAQKKDKPATAQKSNATPGNKPAASHSGRKNNYIDQQDLDSAMKELENGSKDLQENHWSKLQFEIENAMKETDMQKIELDIKAAIKEMDVKSIQAEISAALNQEELAKISKEVAAAVAAIDIAAIRQQVAAAKMMDAKAISQQMEKVKLQLANDTSGLKAQMEIAQAGMKQAAARLQLMKEGLDELEKDGLKKKNEKIALEFKNGILYLGGAPQSQEISDKYKQYFGEGVLHFSPASGDQHKGADL